MISIYTDDNFMVVDEEALNETINQIQSTFKIKIQDNDNEYLGCEFIVSHDNKRGWFGQPHVVESLPKIWTFGTGYLTYKHTWITWFCVY